MSIKPLTPATIPHASSSIEGFELPTHPKAKLLGQIPMIFAISEVSIVPWARPFLPDIGQHRMVSLVAIFDGKDPDSAKIVVKWIQEFLANRKIPILLIEEKTRNIGDIPLHPLNESIRNHCHQQLGITATALPEQFTSKEIERLGLPPFFQAMPPRYLPCFHYTLWQFGEKRVREIVFLQDIQMIPAKLSEWGFTIVKNPQPDDLIAYFANGSFQHLGRYLGEGQVESKWGGKYTNFVYKHPVSLIASNYGNKIAFYRRSCT